MVWWVVDLIEEQTYLSFMTQDSGSKKALSLMVSCMVLAVMYHAFIFWNVKADDVMARNEEPVWDVMFELSNQSATDSRLIQDGSTEQFVFEMDEEISSNRMVGYLNILLEYQETSGNFNDPCDVVSAEIKHSEIVADWNNESNVLSGTSDDCSAINLYLQIYPEFDGVTKNQPGSTSDEVMTKWKSSEYGIGEYLLSVELNTQEFASTIPTQGDNDEEITITWSFVMFSPSVVESGSS